MKKIIITTASVLLLTGVGVGFAVKANADKTDMTHRDIEVTQQAEQLDVEEMNELNTYEEDIQIEVEDKQEFPEYEILENEVNMDDYNVEVLEDNKRKRVMLLKDDNNKAQFKSIYVKNKNRLKVIDFHGGMLFNQVLSTTKEDEVANPGHHEVTEYEVQHNDTSSLEGFAEYSTIANHIDLEEYHVEVVEDNKYKRVILLKDSDERVQYKSIYVKDKNRLKVIDLNGGLIHNSTI